MARLIFRRAASQLMLESASGVPLGSWEAKNNPVAGAQPFPDGTWAFSWWSPHTGETENDAFGANGNFIFEVPGRTGMGVHSGRANAAPPGPAHPTDGCIRTTGAATAKIRQVHDSGDRITELRVSS
jgi:hypothetical protein